MRQPGLFGAERALRARLRRRARGASASSADACVTARRSCVGPRVAGISTHGQRGVTPDRARRRAPSPLPAQRIDRRLGVRGPLGLAPAGSTCRAGAAENIHLGERLLVDRDRELLAAARLRASFLRSAILAWRMRDADRPIGVGERCARARRSCRPCARRESRPRPAPAAPSTSPIAASSKTAARTSAGTRGLSPRGSPGGPDDAEIARQLERLARRPLLGSIERMLWKSSPHSRGVRLLGERQHFGRGVLVFDDDVRDAAPLGLAKIVAVRFVSRRGPRRRECRRARASRAAPRRGARRAGSGGPPAASRAAGRASSGARPARGARHR